MGLETVTWIDDLVTTNPPGSDLKSQGDDHIRNLKIALRNCFPRAGKAFRFPQNLAKSADYSVVASDDKSIISVDTTAGTVTLSLPTLAAGDAGWSIEVVKTNTGTNPCFIAPPSGTINGFTKVRRTLEFVVTTIRWNGSLFFATRPNGGRIGEVQAFFGATLPNDCLWADGAAFSGSNFVELAAVYGATTKPDLRGRNLTGRDNMGVGAANRITAGGGNFDGTILGGTGGAQSFNIAQNQLPNVAPTFTGTAMGTHSHSAPDGQFVEFSGAPTGQLGGSGIGVAQNTNTSANSAGTPAGTISSINGNVAQQLSSLIAPTQIVNFIVVAE